MVILFSMLLKCWAADPHHKSPNSVYGTPRQASLHKRSWTQIAHFPLSLIHLDSH